jgi:hypothetical protein
MLKLRLYDDLPDQPCEQVQEFCRQCQRKPKNTILSPYQNASKHLRKTLLIAIQKIPYFLLQIYQNISTVSECLQNVRHEFFVTRTSRIRIMMYVVSVSDEQ